MYREYAANADKTKIEAKPFGDFVRSKYGFPARLFLLTDPSAQFALNIKSDARVMQSAVDIRMEKLGAPRLAYLNRWDITETIFPNGSFPPEGTKVPIRAVLSFYVTPSRPGENGSHYNITPITFDRSTETGSSFKRSDHIAKILRATSDSFFMVMKLVDEGCSIQSISLPVMGYGEDGLKAEEKIKLMVRGILNFFNEFPNSPALMKISEIIIFMKVFKKIENQFLVKEVDEAIRPFRNQ